MRFAYLIGGVLLDDSLDFDGRVRLFAGRVRWLLVVGRFEAVLIGGLVGGRRAGLLLLLLLHSVRVRRIENAGVSLHMAQVARTGQVLVAGTVVDRRFHRQFGRGRGGRRGTCT